MVDKITTVKRPKMGTKIGIVDNQDLVRIGHGLLVFLGLAGSNS